MEEMDFSDIVDDNIRIILARKPEEILATQRLRYKVFYEELQAVASAEKRQIRRDFDSYDEISDHLLIVDDHAKNTDDYVVGTYRLLRQDVMQAGQSFYTEGEYDISLLKNSGMRLLELGRSCVTEAYRGRRGINLLWRGLARYLVHHQIDAVFGCASFPGLDIQAYQNALAYLHKNHLSPPNICPKALPTFSVSMDYSVDENITMRDIMRSIPPLIKGYLRVGSYVGEGAYIDKTFNTIDICIVMLRENISQRYYKHYIGMGEQNTKKDASI